MYMAKDAPSIRFPFLALLTLSLLSPGCMMEQSWVYGPEPESTESIVVQKSLAVPPFKDLRTNKNSNFFLMYLVPLVPFGWQDYNAPEGASMHTNSGMWKFRPDEDFAKAAAAEVNAAHIFKEAFFTNRASEGELVLEGQIETIGYGGALLSYGLSAYGPLLWIVGFPATVTSNQLAVDLTLKARGDNRILWKKAYKRDGKKVVSWLYYLRPDFHYPEWMKEILVDACKEIREKLSTRKG